MKATIVTLSPKADAVTTSFEEAFGEFSEARGRGRNRRQKRKLDRIAKRRERKKSRQEGRAEQQESRQLRKDVRKTRRVARKGMGDEPELEEQTTTQEQGSEQDSGSSQPVNQESDSAPDNQGEGNGEYQGEGGGYSSDDEGQNESEGGDDAEVDNETGESDEESGFTGEISGIDGAISISPEDAEWNEYFSSADGESKINAKVKDLSRRIEKNKEYILRLQKQVKKLNSTKDSDNEAKRNKQIANLHRLINERKQGLAKLEKLLASYSKFDGDDYSLARGGKRGVAKRKAEVRHAKRIARQERKRARKGTPVEENLNPEFSEQRIEVPAEEVADFSGRTGLIGLDDQEDADAPETRVVDLRFSNVEGEKSHKVRNIAIGVGVGILAILIIRKLTKK